MKLKHTNKILKLSIILLSIIIILTNNVYSLGIAPSKKIIEYSSEEQIITARIINNEAKNTIIVLNVQGALAQYVTLNQTTLNISKYELEKEFTYRIKLPENLEIGTQTINIIASETIGNTNVNTINGLLTLAHQLQINIPYSKKQMEGYVSIATTKIKEPATIKLILKNNGVENINKITGTIKILDNNNNIHFQDNIVEQNNLLVKSEISIDKKVILKNVGEYNIEYNLNYDEKEFNITKKFNMGEYNIAIIDTKVNNFKLGTIAKFDIKIENEWNTILNNIDVELVIKDMAKNIIEQNNIPKNKLYPGNNTLVIYWDTTNITKGEYLLDLKITSDEKIVTSEYTIKIAENSIEINKATYNNATKQKTRNKNFIDIIIEWYKRTIKGTITTKEI
jgi:hypothetical protein